MGVSHSETVSVIAEGHNPGPFALRRHPKCPKGTFQNPEEYPTMKEVALEYLTKYGPKPYLGERKLIGNNQYDNEFHFITYSKALEISKNFGSGLARLNIRVGDNLGVYAENCIAWLNAIDASCLYGFSIVSLYDSLGPDALQFLLGHSKMECVLVSQKNLPKILNIISDTVHYLRYIILISDDIPETANQCKVPILTFRDVCNQGIENPIDYPPIDPESPHFICYSSGTTGNPKGVIVSHRAAVSNALGSDRMIQVGNGARHLSYLPLAHVFERAAVVITSRGGGKIGFISGGVTNLVSDMNILKPTFFPAVPRVMNRFYDSVQEKLKQSTLKRAIFWGSWYAKKFCLDYNLPTFLFDVAVFNQIKKTMGGSIDQFIVGGAALDPRVHEFLQVATGIPLRAGYGLTEAGAGNICNPFNVHTCKPGTVGGPLEHVEVYLEPIDGYDDPEAGEIIIGGQCLSSGYLHDSETTENLFTTPEHKFIHTGDVGKWDDDGYMRIVDRIRSIFKLSQGEYVAAEVLTQIYDAVDIVSQSFIYGDSQRSYLVAIIVPSINEVAKFLGKSSLTQDEFVEACQNDSVKDEILTRLRSEADKMKLFGYQRIIKILLEPNPWTVENEYLTPTFKLKRKKLENKYMAAINRLYED